MSPDIQTFIDQKKFTKLNLKYCFQDPYIQLPGPMRDCDGQCEHPGLERHLDFSHWPVGSMSPENTFMQIVETTQMTESETLGTKYNKLCVS